MTDGSDHEHEQEVESLVDLDVTPEAAADVTGGAEAAPSGSNRGRYQVRLDEARKLLG